MSNRLTFLAAGLALAVPCAVAKPAHDGIPQRGDVILRTLRVTESKPHRLGTIDAGKAFGASRLEWIYEVNEAFIDEAEAEGFQVGTTMSLNAWPKVQEAPDFIERFTARDLEGNPVARFNFRKFEDWETRHFSPDINLPAWIDFYISYLEELYRLPVSTIMRDDQAANFGLIKDGGTYTDASVEKFRTYLMEKVSDAELDRLGIDDPANFDIRSYLLERGAPGTREESEHRKWARWDGGGPVLRLYAQFQMQATAEFYRRIREEVEATTGRRIAWACNHTGQWGPIERNFDYALGEFYTHQMQMETMVEIARRADNVGKLQGLQGVLDGNWENRDPEGIVEEMRLGFGTAYALGMLPMVPWDMYMPGRAKRYYAKTSDFADLFRWVSDNRQWFDEYETALVTAYDPVSSRHRWRANQEILRAPLIDARALRVNQAGVLGVVRQSQERASPNSVVHLVDWNRERLPFEATLDLLMLCGSSAAKVTLLRPGSEPLVLGDGTDSTFELPALNPWGMLLVEASDPPEGLPLPPVLLAPASPVVPRGSALALSADDAIEIRQLSPETTEWVTYRPGFGIEHDCLLEARTVVAVQGQTVYSPGVRWQFWTYRAAEAEEVPMGIGHSLTAALVENSGGNAIQGAFADGAPLIHNSREFKQAIGTIGDVTMTAELPENTAWIQFGIALPDDAASMRPGFRITVEIDGAALYETRIINTVKGVLHAQEPTFREYGIAVPQGAREVSLKLHRTGWFDSHNRVIWIEPQAIAGEEGEGNR